MPDDLNPHRVGVAEMGIQSRHHHGRRTRLQYAQLLDAMVVDVVAREAAHLRRRREQGREAFAAFLVRMDAHYSERLHDIVVMASPDGERAAAEYVVHGEYRVTDEGLPEARGQRYVLPGGAFFAIRDGRISRVTNHYNLQDWITQVGG